MATEGPLTVAVTVVFSPTSRSVQEIDLHLPRGCLVADAMKPLAPQWGIAPARLQALDIGIWGKSVSPQQVLCEGDRLEIYRPLTVDPKVARRERFVRQGAKSAGLFATRRAGAKAGY